MRLLLPVTADTTSTATRHNNALACFVLTATAVVVLSNPTAVVAFLPLAVQRPTGGALLRTAQQQQRQHDDEQQHRQRRRRQPFSGVPSWTDNRHDALQMAFQTAPEDSNIFDGPMALTRERDACGVGFIANTQSGGKWLPAGGNVDQVFVPSFGRNFPICFSFFFGGLTSPIVVISEIGT